MITNIKELLIVTHSPCQYHRKCKEKSNTKAKLKGLFLLQLTEFFYLGLALPFLTKVFQVWVKEKDFTSLSSALRKAELENKLLVSET